MKGGWAPFVPPGRVPLRPLDAAPAPVAAGNVTEAEAVCATAALPPPAARPGFTPLRPAAAAPGIGALRAPGSCAAAVPRAGAASAANPATRPAPGTAESFFSVGYCKRNDLKKRKNKTFLVRQPPPSCMQPGTKNVFPPLPAVGRDQSLPRFPSPLTRSPRRRMASFR
jgi:hypothetical protein